MCLFNYSKLELQVSMSFFHLISLILYFYAFIVILSVEQYPLGDCLLERLRSP